MMVAESFTDLLTDVNHWGFEAVSDVVLGMMLYPAIRWAVRKHDRKKHGL